MTPFDRIQAPTSVQEINKLYYEMGLTDGLPIIPPTPEAVDEMIEGSGRDRGEIIGFVPPKNGVATIEKIATNATMAGCLPSHMPVLIAALEACLEDGFNLYGVQNTTHPTGPLVMVHGPAAKALGINAGYDCMGHGVLANATIGRALRLMLINLGGGMSRATQGFPGKYTFCFAELEDESPWAPYHVDKGFDANESAVTVFGAGGTMNMRPFPRRGRDVLAGFARMMALGGSPRCHGYALIVINPEHARLIAEDGFSKEAARDYLFENARVRPAGYPDEVAQTWIEERGLEHMDVRQIIGEIDRDTLVPSADYRENIHLVVAGGSGGHSVYIPLCFTQPLPVVTKGVHEGTVAVRSRPQLRRVA